MGEGVRMGDGSGEGHGIRGESDMSGRRRLGVVGEGEAR